MHGIHLKHGMFAWADLVAHDPEGAKAFYGGLFAWATAPLPDHPGSGYTLFTLDDERVAGLVPMSAERKHTGAPPFWMSYILVDDVDAVAARVPRLGGRIVAGPMDVVDSGRMAVTVDPSGAPVGLWQAGTHAGAERFNEPGCMTWNELLTRDPQAARAFFGSLLGWHFDEVDLGERGVYHLARVDGRPNAGLMDMPAEAEGIPPHWDVYFAVDDVDAAARRAVDLGGSLFVPPTDIPRGRFCGVTDPWGAHFTIYRPAEATPTG